MIYDSQRGVSDTVGVILMVAIVVILAAVIAIFATDVGGNLTENASAGVTSEETPEGVKVTLNNMIQAEVLRILVNGKEIDGAKLTEVGDYVTVTAPEDATVTIVAETEEGEETVISSVNTDNDTTGGSNPKVIASNTGAGAAGPDITGTVSFNPPAEGVTIKALDSNGNVIAQDTTDKNGEFTVPSGADSYTLNGYNVNTTVESGVDIEVDSSDVEKNGDPVPKVLMEGNGTSSDPYQVEYASDLQSMMYVKDANYLVVNNINASHTQDWNDGKGFKPVGSGGNPFTGSLDGDGNEITGLTINRPNEWYIGLFGYLKGDVSNVGIVSADIVAKESVGALAGMSEGGTISNSYTSGRVEVEKEDNWFPWRAGGLVGGNMEGSTIINSHSSADVFSQTTTGGLAGYNEGTVTDSYATGSVTGEGGTAAGGLIGDNQGGTVTDSYATGDVNSSDQLVGGLVGASSDGKIEHSYATGNVSGSGSVGGLVGVNKGKNIIVESYSTGNVTSTGGYSGGLVGTNDSGGTISNSYATGSVTGDDKVGGLVGYMSNYSGDGTSISNSYATGSVTGNSKVGGVVGYITSGELSSSYWDTETTGKSNAVGINYGTVNSTTGLTTSEMTGSSAESNMGELDFTSIWATGSNGEYPVLQWQN